MKVLIIDSVLPELTVGLIDATSAKFKHSPHQRSHDKHINTLVSELLKEEGTTFEDLGYYAVVAGPGSWTGCRVGVAAVKGFCAAVPKPVVALNTLTIISYRSPLPAVLHSHADVYYTEIGGVYSSEKMDNTKGCVTLADIGKEEYLQNMAELTRNAIKRGNTIEAAKLLPFYITDFEVKT